MNTDVNETRSRQGRRSWRSSIIRLLWFATFGYGGLLAILMINETWLVYPGSKFPKGDWTPAHFAYEEVAFRSSDSTNLVGWFLPKPVQEADDESDSQTILLCHGNAENAAQSSAYIGDMLRSKLNADVFVFDYRGYGKSEGTPAEQGILNDSESALMWLSERTKKPPAEIIVVGHSIGGGPACHLASVFNCKALVLQCTFSSLTDAAQATYPIFPVRFLMRNRYPSAEKIKLYNGPVFQSHGNKDEVIPIRLARRLFSNAPTSQKEFLEIEGMSHYEPLPEYYWERLRSFVTQLPR